MLWTPRKPHIITRRRLLSGAAAASMIAPAKATLLLGGVGPGAGAGDGGSAPDTTPPVITSDNYVFVNSGVALNHQLTANEVVTWSITGGADAAHFSLTGDGSILHMDAKNDSAPDDANTNGVYNVQITATDTSGNTGVQNFSAELVPAAVWVIDPGVNWVEEDLSAWTASNIQAVTTGVADPAGGTGAFDIIFPNDGGNIRQLASPYTSSGNAFVPGTPYRFSFRFKPGAFTVLPNVEVAAFGNVYVDPSDQSFHENWIGTLVNSHAAALTGGWWYYGMDFLASEQWDVQMFIKLGNAGGGFTPFGDGTSVACSIYMPRVEAIS